MTTADENLEKRTPRSIRIREEMNNKHWHLDRKVPIVLIFSVLALLAAQVYAAGVTSAKFEELRTTVQLILNDRIHKTTVLEMFNVRDVEIDHLKIAIGNINTGIRENNKLLIKIITSLPKQ